MLWISTSNAHVNYFYVSLSSSDFLLHLFYLCVKRCAVVHNIINGIGIPSNPNLQLLHYEMLFEKMYQGRQPKVNHIHKL